MITCFLRYLEREKEWTLNQLADFLGRDDQFLKKTKRISDELIEPYLKDMNIEDIPEFLKKREKKD
jgi:hypothetical protein